MSSGPLYHDPHMLMMLPNQPLLAPEWRCRQESPVAANPLGFSLLLSWWLGDSQMGEERRVTVAGINTQAMDESNRGERIALSEISDGFYWASTHRSGEIEGALGVRDPPASDAVSVCALRAWERRLMGPMRHPHREPGMVGKKKRKGKERSVPAQGQSPARPQGERKMGHGVCLPPFSFIYFIFF